MCSCVSRRVTALALVCCRRCSNSINTRTPCKSRRPICGRAIARIRCNRVEDACRRRPPKLSQAEARTPQGSGSLCFCLTQSFQAAIVLHDIGLQPRERSLKIRKQRGETGHWNGSSPHITYSALVTKLANVSALEAEFWEFESPPGHQFSRTDFSGCSVNLVDGLPWKQEAAGSNPATQTIYFFSSRV